MRRLFAAITALALLACAGIAGAEELFLFKDIPYGSTMDQVVKALNAEGFIASKEQGYNVDTGEEYWYVDVEYENVFLFEKPVWIDPRFDDKGKLEAFWLYYSDGIGNRWQSADWDLPKGSDWEAEIAEIFAWFYQGAVDRFGEAAMTGSFVMPGRREIGDYLLPDGRMDPDAVKRTLKRDEWIEMNTYFGNVTCYLFAERIYVQEEGNISYMCCLRYNAETEQEN